MGEISHLVFRRCLRIKPSIVFFDFTEQIWSSSRAQDRESSDCFETVTVNGPDLILVVFWLEVLSGWRVNIDLCLTGETGSLKAGRSGVPFIN